MKENTKWFRRRVLALIFAASSSLASLCGSGAEINGVKLSPAGIRVDAIYVGGGQPGRDDSAGQAGRTEYDGTAQRCPMGSDGRRHCQ